MSLMSAPDSGPKEPGDAFDERYFKETYGCDGLDRFGMHWWSVRWYASIVKRWLRTNGGKRILEIGCGHGFMLARLESEFTTYGIDISEYAISQAARFAPQSICTVADIGESLPEHLEAGSFDVVVAKYVFEHLPRPFDGIRHAASTLRPGGILFISVPNTESIGARWKSEDWYAKKDPTHISLLAPDEWLELLGKSGLQLYKESSDGFWDLPYVRWLPAWLQFPVFIGPTALSCLTGRAILPPRCGENLLIFARKPNVLAQSP
jgi:SAM-dependent methyltransferase